MKQLLLFCLCLTTLVVQAQTKKIAFKSHSGSSSNFSIALEKDLFDMDNSNFGHAPQRDVKTAQLDSVIFISDTVAVMVTSEYCKRPDQEEKQARLWKAGRETVINHPLFSRKHSLDSIRNIIREQYNFRNPVEKVVFVGYDNKVKKTRKNTALPIIATGNDNNQSPFDGQFVLILSLIAVASLLAAFVSLQLYKLRESKVSSHPTVRV
ncbi:MAG: hypothetical protein ABL876_05255 [Chitinophagaceae bacterium]